MSGSRGISLNYQYAVSGAGALDSGAPSAEEMLSVEPAFTQGRTRLLAEVSAGKLGFWNLPTETQYREAIERYVRELGDTYRNVLVLGIGGSSLGARALDHALAGPPELPRSGRRLYFPDNSDPTYLASLLKTLDPSDTLVLAISKSGGTVETAAQMLVVRAWLRETLDEAAYRRGLVMITDPENGPLREIAQAEGLCSFPVPASVGGRFSVLSPVGLLPAALAGIDIQALLAGAADQAKACTELPLAKNPAALYAAIHTLHHRDHQRPIHVMMPYCDALRPFSQWFVQLWAESLGKRHDRDGKLVESGPTPIAAVGATDQHAQVQLFMEGPRDKVVTFVAVNSPAADLKIPEASGDLSYLGGLGMQQILDAELRGTARALAGDQRPSVEICLEKLDAYHLGSLMFFFEAATAFAGELYHINTFDQPGVEAGKRIAFGLLGRTGYETSAHENAPTHGNKITKYRVSA